MADSTSAATSVTLFALVFGVPAVLALLVGISKGYRWWVCALLGLTSLLGLAIAIILPTKNQRRSTVSALGGSDQVKLLTGNAPVPHRTIGEISVETRGVYGKDFEASSAALRAKAATLGANAVTQLQYSTKQGSPWRLWAETIVTAHGVAVHLEEGEQAGDVPDAEAQAVTRHREEQRSHLLGGVTVVVGMALWWLVVRPRLADTPMVTPPGRPLGFVEGLFTLFLTYVLFWLGSAGPRGLFLKDDHAKVDEGRPFPAFLAWGLAALGVLCAVLGAAILLSGGPGTSFLLGGVALAALGIFLLRTRRAGPR